MNYNTYYNTIPKINKRKKMRSIFNNDDMYIIFDMRMVINVHYLIFFCWYGILSYDIITILNVICNINRKNIHCPTPNECPTATYKRVSTFTFSKKNNHP